MFDRGIGSGEHERFVPVRVADQVRGMAVTASNLEDFRSVLCLTDHSTVDVQTVSDDGSHASCLLDDLVIQSAPGRTVVEGLHGPWLGMPSPAPDVAQTYRRVRRECSFGTELTPEQI